MQNGGELGTSLSRPRCVVTRKIAIVLSHGCDLLAVCTIAEVLVQARDLSDPLAAGANYEVHHLSATGGNIRCTPALTVSTSSLLEVVDQRLDHVILACGPGDERTAGEVAPAAWLQRMRNRGSTIRSISGMTSGQFKQGSSRLGPEWRLQTSKSRMLPALSAVFEIIRADLGSELALEAIRRATGERDLLVGYNATKSVADKVRFAAHWLRENCHRPLSVTDVANACALSERSLLRHFTAHLNTSPSEYLQRVRLERACGMLAYTSLPADKIARRVGLNSGDRLGRILRRVTGLSPTEYRAMRHQATATHSDTGLLEVPPETSGQVETNAESPLLA